MNLLESVDEIITARWVAPIAPQNVVLENHSIAIKNGQILALLPQHEMMQRYQSPIQHQLTTHVLMPGLINAHAHSPMSLFRGLADDLKLMDWLQNHIWPAEQAIINEQSVADGSRLAIAEMLRGGITCFNDHYFFPNTIAETAMACGMRTVVGLVIMSVPTQWAQSEQDYFNRARDTLENGPRHHLIRYALAPHAPYTVSDQSLQQIQTMGEQHQLPIHMHVHETQQEIEDSVRQYGIRPLTRLHQHGLLNERFINVHMVHLIDEEIALLQQTGASVVHCPESNLKLASGFAPIHQLMQANINVALGTDGAASNNDLDLFAEMQTAAMLAKAVSGEPTALPAAEALQMATLNGAKALGLGHEIGSLEPGKWADVIAVDLNNILTQPIYHPMSSLVYAMNRQQVSDVWIHGQHLLKRGEFVLLEIAPIIQQAEHWAGQAQSLQHP